MDNDDISLPFRLEEQVKFMDKHSDITMAGSWCELFSSRPDNGIISYLKYCFYNLGWLWTQKNFPDWSDMFQGNPVMHTTSILRSCDIKNIVYVIIPTTALLKITTSAAKYWLPD